MHAIQYVTRENNLHKIFCYLISCFDREVVALPKADFCFFICNDLYLYRQIDG